MATIGGGMKSLFKEVKEVIRILEKRNLIAVLRDCRDLSQRYKKLIEIFPELYDWDPMPGRQLVFYLQHKHKLDFGVCAFYKIEGDRQYCTYGGKKIECLCVVPQVKCDLRDLLKIEFILQFKPGEAS